MRNLLNAVTMMNALKIVVVAVNAVKIVQVSFDKI